MAAPWSNLERPPCLAHSMGPSLRSEFVRRVTDVLKSASIAYTFWFEDVLYHYGYPVVAFDVQLLVPSVDQAAACLTASGFVPTVRSEYALESWEDDQDHAVLAHVSEVDSKDANRLVLLAASAWLQSQSQQSQDPLGYPTLPDFYLGLVYRYVRAKKRKFKIYLHVQVAYANDTLSANEIHTARLDKLVRQFRLDSLSGFSMDLPKVLAREKEIMEQIEEGTWKFCIDGDPEVYALQFTERPSDSTVAS